jgi:hypothetical protein
MPDCYEELHACLDPSTNDASLDADGDGLTNLQEYLIGTDPCVQDTDGDGCGDAQELAMGFNPNAWYDFYDVPVPSLMAGAGGTYNGAVNIGDVLAVNSYSGVRAGQADYEADVNGNTVHDGLEYDRSPSPPPNPPYDAGPPSGAIGLSDVLAVNSQVGLSCRRQP